MFTPFAFIKRQVSAAIVAAQRILIAGQFSSFNTPTGSNAAKLINGSTQIDTTFNVGSGADGRILASAIDENSKILIGGQFTSYSGSSQNYIARINTDGTRDTSFNIGTGFNGFVNTIFPVSQSKILVGGGFSGYSGSIPTYLTRLNSNGTIDSTYANLTFNNSVYTVVTQSDGKIIVGGDFSNTGYNQPYLVKLTPELNPETTFNPGIGPSNVVYTFASQSDGKIIFGGVFTTYSGSSASRIERINTDGTIDTSFNQGVGFNGDVYVVKVQPDGKILVGGGFTSYSGSSSPRIVRLNSNGTKDLTFNPGAGPTNIVYDMQLQSDNKIVAVGAFTTTYSGSTSPRIVRINTDGTKDFTFNMGTAGFSANQYSAQIQADGKIIVAGVAGTYSGSASQRIRRINTNGTNDTSFNQGTGPSGTVYKAKIQPDQKIIILFGGTSYSGSSVNRITRINTNGTRDTTFNLGTGFDAVSALPSALELDSSGSIYVGSNFATYSGSTVNSFVKLTSSGSIITGSGLYKGFSNVVNSLLVDSTGSVYAGGGFTSYISPNNDIVRLNIDGTKDFTFQIGTGFDSIVYSLKVQPDDKIVVGGNFTTYSGSANNDIVRLNSNGTKDTSFNMGTGFNSSVFQLALQSDGKILALGSSTSYSGSAINYLTRINTDGTKDTSFTTTDSLNSGGIGNTNSSLVVDNSGSIHTVTTQDAPVSGYPSKYVKFNSSGSVNFDGLFMNVNIGLGGPLSSLAIDNSNNVFILGKTGFTMVRNINTGIIAFNSSGNTTSSLFNPGVGFLNTQSLSTGYPIASTKIPSGDIWLGGYFTLYSGSNVSQNDYTGVIKINQQGKLTTVASSSVGGFYNTISSLQPQSDGKLLVGMDGGNGTYENPVRVNLNGSPDTSFVAAPTHYGPIYTMHVQSTGKVLIGGDFGYPIDDNEGGYTTTSPFYFLRLNPSGSLDGTFPTGQANGGVYTINALANDSSILTGNFTYYAATSSNFIAKINSEGIRDASYNVGTGFGNGVYKSTLQSDGKLIAAGGFTTYSGSTINRLARINTDGTLDTTFNPGSGFNTFNSSLSKIVVDNLGNIHIVGGGFTSYSGSAISGYVKILPNGALDLTGTSGSFVISNPYTMELLD